MRKIRVLVIVLLVLAMSVSQLSCAKSEKTVTIGAVGPLTGGSSNGGTDELEGKQMAIEDFNKAGGLNGVKVVLVSEDDASQPSQSAAAVTKLITQNKVKAILGAHNSSCTLADMEVIAKYGVPMLTPGSTAVTVTASGNKWITRVCPVDSLQAQALISYVSKKFTYKKIGIIYVNDEVGKSGLKALSEAAAKVNIAVASETFGTEDNDMTAIISKLKSQNVEALFLWCQYTPGALIMKQTRGMNWDVPFYSYTGTIHQDTFDLSNGTYVGTVNSVPFVPTGTDPKIVDFVKRYKEKFGETPSQNSARAYDTTMVLLNAMKNSDYNNAAKLQEAIRNTKNYDGLQGKISIDPATGEYIGDVMIVKAKADKTWEYLESATSAK